MDRIDLRRALGLPLFIFYGLGTILGAGSAGMYAPIAFVAFHAFIGFEDMANIAEEVRDPVVAGVRVLPVGIPVLGLLCSGGFLPNKCS